MKYTNQQVAALWKEKVAKNASKLDSQNDKGGHDWHSLWAGFVIGLGRPDLSNWDKYMKIGFQVEGGNVGHHPGTTTQEVLRALIDRARYVNDQTPCEETAEAITLMATAVYLFEKRAAARHGRLQEFLKIGILNVVHGALKCHKCGHVGCKGDCH